MRSSGNRPRPAGTVSRMPRPGPKLAQSAHGAPRAPIRAGHKVVTSTALCCEHYHCYLAALYFGTLLHYEGA